MSVKRINGLHFMRIWRSRWVSVGLLVGVKARRDLCTRKIVSGNLNEKRPVIVEWRYFL